MNFIPNGNIRLTAGRDVLMLFVIFYLIIHGLQSSALGAFGMNEIRLCHELTNDMSFMMSAGPNQVIARVRMVAHVNPDNKRLWIHRNPANSSFFYFSQRHSMNISPCNVTVGFVLEVELANSAGRTDLTYSLAVRDSRQRNSSSSDVTYGNCHEFYFIDTRRPIDVSQRTKEQLSVNSTFLTCVIHQANCISNVESCEVKWSKTGGMPGPPQVTRLSDTPSTGSTSIHNSNSTKNQGHSSRRPIISGLTPDLNPWIQLGILLFFFLAIPVLGILICR